MRKESVSRKDPSSIGFNAGPHLFVGTMPYADDSRYSADEIYKVVANNLKGGVRHIDTAELYEDALPHVAKAIRDSKIARNQLFICSKIKGLPSEDYEQVKERIQKHMKALGISYLDLLLIHWPGMQEATLEGKADAEAPLVSFELFDASIDKAWANMAQLKKDKFVTRVGISNFYRQHLHRLQNSPYVKDCPPVVNQIYLDATHHEYDFVKAMLKAGIQVMCYRPIEFLNTLRVAAEMGDTVYAELEELRKEASPNNEYKSVEQFVLAWLFARGINVCVKSSNYYHIKDNVTALKKRSSFPEGLMEKFPKPTELSTMMLAYDEYAELFQKV